MRRRCVRRDLRPRSFTHVRRRDGYFLMCGIAGILNLNGAPVDPCLPRKMIELLRHRGPDGVGYYCGAGVALGHARLSIIDLSGGHQPMANEDRSLWITFNGEI